MIEIMTTDGVWHPIYGVPHSFYNSERDLRLTRNENENNTYLIGDGGSSPMWIELTEVKEIGYGVITWDNDEIYWNNSSVTFGDAVTFNSYLAHLEDIVSRAAKVRLDGDAGIHTQVRVTFGYVFGEYLENMGRARYTIKLAPAVAGFPLANSGIIYWGDTVITLGTENITLDGNTI
jgi:hypothetical protein